MVCAQSHARVGKAALEVRCFAGTHLGSPLLIEAFAYNLTEPVIAVRWSFFLRRSTHADRTTKESQL